jgi:hypothetical protein
MMGMIQCIFAVADQPYQLYAMSLESKALLRISTYKSPAGTKNEPKIIAGMRISGFPTPPLRSDNWTNLM